MIMKLAVIGGASTYTPELIDGVLRRRDRLPITEITLCDINQERLDVVGGFARRMAQAAGGGIEISFTNSQAEAVTGADFVVSQFRIGQQAARHRDEMLGREFNLVGQETVGVGGFAKGLRTIPVALKLADTILQHAPNAQLLNFTNPAGMITEALLRERPQLKTIGLCNVPWNVKNEIAETLSVPFADIELDYVGLNHLSWVRGMKIDGVDRSQEAIGGFRGLIGKQAPAEDEPAWREGSVDLMQAIPNYYLLYYYETQSWLKYQKTHPTRASEVMKIEDELIIKYADPTLTTKPEELMKRGGAYYSDSAAELMADIASDANSIHIVNTTHRGAVPGMIDGTVMELPCVINKNGATPIATSAMRPDVDALVRSVKDFELLTINAAVHGDEDSAIRALIANPLGPDMSVAPQLWKRVQEEHKGLLGALDA
jgi:6-phospho-beta-glucosidase